MHGLRIPLSRPAETSNPGFVYNPDRISLVPVEPGTGRYISIHELAGDWEQAARDYEKRGDYARAAECAEKARGGMAAPGSQAPPVAPISPK